MNIFKILFPFLHKKKPEYSPDTIKFINLLHSLQKQREQAINDRINTMIIEDMKRRGN